MMLLHVMIGASHTLHTHTHVSVSALCTAAKHGSPRTRTRTRRIIQHHPHTHSRSTPYIYKVFQHLLQWLVVIRMQFHQISSLCQTPNTKLGQDFRDDSGVRTHSYECPPHTSYKVCQAHYICMKWIW